MAHPLNTLDPASRNTIQAFLDASLGLSASGMQQLLAEDCIFEGALSAGSLRGRPVVLAHLRQVFRGVASKGAARILNVDVEGRCVQAHWEIFAPGAEEARGQYTLILDDSGLIASIKVEWDPRQVQSWKAGSPGA